MAKPQTQGLALQRIEGNLVFTRSEVWAWFVLPPQRWFFRPDVDRINLYDSISTRLADLPNRKLHLRTTSMPYPASKWARRLDELTPNPVDPTAWEEYLTACQDRMKVATSDTKRVYLGVSLTRRIHERKQIERELRIVSDIVGGDGVEGVPASTADLEWLLHRSVGLCLPPPEKLSAVPEGSWDDTDLYQITDAVQHETSAFGPTVKVTRHGSEPFSLHVAVQTLGKIDEIYGVDTSVTPWLSVPDSMPFPVEISAQFQIIPGVVARKSVASILRHIQDQRDAYAEARAPIPKALGDQAALGTDKEDEMRRGVPARAARAHGWVRFAVPGWNAEDAMDNARALADRYRSLQMDVVHPRGVASGAAQADLIREFVPGEPVRSKAYMRRVPVRYIAAGLPQAGSVLGDNRGGYLGYTTGTGKKSVMFDPFYAMEVRDEPGLVPILGTLGAGKSVLAGAICETEVLRGATGIVFDPSGPLARLTEIPALRRVSRHIPLTQAASGTLNPYSVVEEPKRFNFDTEDEWAEAKVAARQERKMLALDVLTMLLPPSLAQEGRTQLLLSEAVRKVEGRPSTPLTQVLDELDKLGVDDEFARRISGMLHDAADLPLSRLFFHTGGSVEAIRDDVKFTVLTMPGLVLPPTKVAQENWSVSERLVVPLLHLAAWYTSRLIYSRPRSERKIVFIDEGHWLADWPAGRALFNRLGRDNRKWNTAVLFATHNPKDVLGLGESNGNLIGTAFVGRIRDKDTAADALRMLDVSVGVGYENTLARLNGTDGKAPYREFIMLDSGRNVDKVRIDLQHRPALLAALDTTPKQVNPEERAA